MPSTLITLRSNDLTSRQLAAVKQKAAKLGVTPKQYVRQLIAEDLEIDRRAREATFEELAAPFREALGGLSEKELDEIVDKARRSQKRRPSRR